MTNWIERLPQKSAFKIQYDFSGIIIQYESAKSKVFDTIYMWKFSRRWIRLSTSRSWERRGLNQLWRTNTSNSFQGPIFERCNNPMRNCQRIKQNAALWERSLPFWAACVAERDAAHIITHKKVKYMKGCAATDRGAGVTEGGATQLCPRAFILVWTIFKCFTACKCARHDHTL